MKENWIQTHTGVKFCPLDPRTEDIDPLDIAHALGMICRYNGHVKEYYSVAEHCVHVSYHVPEEYALWGLLHDAAEAYLTDMPRPLKRAVFGYKVFEAQLMDKVVERFDLTPEKEPEEVKRVDAAMLATEHDQVMRVQTSWLLPEPPLDDVTIHFWPPKVATARFALRLDELTCK